MSVRTRFSPSPTGKIHLGNARAAFFSALYAKKHNGAFILRIEDTDVERSKEEHVDQLCSDLAWLDIHWQEGPMKEGEYGPYWQSQRQDIYAKHYDTLHEKGVIYPCFCQDHELNLARKLQLSRGQAPRYNGKCKKLSKDEIDALIAEGKTPAWRFAVPDGEAIEFEDSVKGPQKFMSDDIGDFIIRRADGSAPFLFCNAVDDAMMQVSHVLRGDDHLANTPRQIMILKELGLTPPSYGHLSLIIGGDGAPLSKRHGSFSLHQLREDGFLAHALMNYLAHLGHSTEFNDLSDFDTLASHFELKNLSTSPTRFDVEQLMYWQKTVILAMTDEELAEWLGERVLGQVPEDKRVLFIETIKPNIKFPDDALDWAKNFFHDEAPLEAENAKWLKEAGEQYFVVAEEAVNQYGVDYQAIIATMKSELGVSGKKLFMPLRIALTGKNNGPELAQIVALLGVEKLKHRFSSAFKRAETV